ncbi:hypothetical protein [Achromobacter sp. MFA1 R4]|uniref:hypothetical protein n=1 Tax=Achromobacter sp. MFA1 R4 TaxID=1881016 RepID=UPI0012EC72EF|nr:hypothetical protein [Achromobacter sp. MFA1 R4]
MREDAIQLSALEGRIDLEQIPFDRSLIVFSKFLLDVSREYLKENKIEHDFFEWIDETLRFPVLFFSGKCSVEEFGGRRIDAWVRHDAEKNSLKKAILRAIVCCLYEGTSDRGEEYETPEMMELFFSVLLDVDVHLCSRFRKFFENEVGC